MRKKDIRGAGNPNWKGGRRKRNGYTHIKLQPDDFFYPMTREDGYVFEHRLIVARALNRCLLSWEIVHHKNGIRVDNRMENLELLPARKYHLIDSHTKSRIKVLENMVESLKRKLAEVKSNG